MNVKRRQTVLLCTGYSPGSPMRGGAPITHNEFMFTARWSVMFTTFLLLQSSHSSSAFASSRVAPPKAQVLSADYAFALFAADHFLQAWQSGDTENGIALLTSHAKQTATVDGIDKFFSTSTPSAFEIGHGKLLKQGRYEFPVVLLDTSNNNHSRCRFSTIIVLHSGNNDWAVDKLP
jgi:hypothetical protein